MLQRAAPATTPYRFVSAKVWALRLGIIGVVACSFGLFGHLITHSWWGTGALAMLGTAVIARRAFRIDRGDIRF